MDLNTIGRIEKVCRIGATGLLDAKRVHDDLGRFGLNKIQNNRFGEMALSGDVACEKAVIDVLEISGIPIRLYSEEHGDKERGMTSFCDKPIFTGVLDGIDGSFQYKKGVGENRYGTMFQISQGVDPTYNDYIFCGVMEHCSGNLYVATKNYGSELRVGECVGDIQTSDVKKLSHDTKIYADEHWDVVNETFSNPLKADGFDVTCLSASCIYYMDVANGSADLALECTRKGNLELMVAYGLIKEAGGVMVTLDGEDIGDQKYLSFGQGEREHIPIITAATQELAEDLIDYLSRK